MADEVVSTPTVPVVDPGGPPKAGYKTSEAWLAAATAAVGAFAASGLWPNDSVPMKVAGIVAAVLASLGYSISRGMVKSAYHGAPKSQEKCS